MIQSLLNGFSQLRDPSAKKVVLISVGASVLTYIFLFGFINLTLNHTSLFQVRWIESFSDLLGHFAAVMLTWLLFPATISAIIGLLLENIASAVEARHYPNLPPISNPPLFSSLVISGKFLALLLVLNIGLLFLLFTGPVYLVLYYLINGYLISREFFDLVALRRLNLARSRVLQKRFKYHLIFLGTIFVFLMKVPIVNLLVPIIATATMVHLVEYWRAKDGSVDVKV